MAVEVPQTLTEAVMEFWDDPLGFVYFAWPWRRPQSWDGGANLLAGEDGPDVWQISVLNAIGEAVRAQGDVSMRAAVASGHGCGKSALTAWIIIWYLSTRPHPQCVVTANTKPQLDTKTWRELAKWHRLAANAAWFRWTATKFYHVDAPSTWFAASIPWSKDRPEAFAGTHEEHVLIIFDESSAIDDVIWDTAEGAMTTPGAMWLAFGNPTRNTGRFKEIFPGGRFAHRWATFKVDSRSAKKANQNEIAQWIADYGEDSDFVRVRVRGEFPRASAMQFIPEDVVQAARQRQPRPELIQIAPKILGVDVARTGENATVLTLRQGPKIVWKKKYRDLTLDRVEDLIAEAIDLHDPDATIIDAVGLGAGPVDNLKYRRHYPVTGVYGSEAAESSAEARNAPDHKVRYHNLRAEMWGKMLEWLRGDGCLPPEDHDLAAQLTSVEYRYDSNYRIQLEKKEDMLKRGLASPDDGDSLALTFSKTVHKRARQPRGQQFAKGPGSPFARAGV